MGFALLPIAASAAEAVLPLKTGVPAALELPWPYDESALQEPRGYNHHGALSRHFVQRLTIENTGAQPIAFTDILVDGRDWRARWQPQGARRIFTAWTLARSHAASGSKLAQHPWQMLHFWGYTLCGEDTKGLSALLKLTNTEGRSVPLNGHVAGEYSIDGRWSVLDGDQNIVYYNLDNRTLAGYAEIRADPFLALRTKPFGRYAEASLAASQFNAGLFEYIEPTIQKPFKHKESEETAATGATQLFPGEELIYHYDRSPEIQAGAADAPEWKRAAPAALRLLELRVLPRARGWRDGPLEVRTGWPILAAKNLETGESAEVNPAEVAFSCRIPVAKASDRLTVTMQRSQVSLPAFHRGKNTVTLAGTGGAEATLRINYETENLPPQPAAPTVDCASLFHDEAPRFAIGTEEGCDRIWWQVANDPTFQLPFPNFDQIQKTTAQIEVNPLDNTFFSDRADYYIRAKTVRQGVWSEWAEYRKFRIEKPLAPFDLTASKLPDGRVHLQWKGPGEEFAIYASNRLDFLPDCYADEQIHSMLGHVVLGQRPNKNQIATSKDRAIDLAPYCFYRLRARRGAAWSNPSLLLALPPAVFPNLPAPVVFQIRWRTDETAAVRDIYLGDERPLRP